ncbi:hypothetical protein [Photobacterium damselae]|uniref:hypothetical protein n=1 Tax=Photobacterium damselae TaxID=38293 RepID=UPI0035A90210
MNKIIVMLLLITPPFTYAKVTEQQAFNDSKYYAQQIHGISQQEALNDWKLNGRAPNEVNDNDWELRVWSSITRGGCCGYVTRTWYGKFDKKTGRFLGYINQHYESDSINGPGGNWK